MARNTSKTLFCNPLLGDREKPGAKEGGGTDLALLCPPRTAVPLDTSMGTEAEEIHDRYLLTELGSCGIGKGFVIKKGVKNRFYRLDRETNHRLESVFRADQNSKPKPHLSFRIGTVR